jgi:tetratricopeptide (TPR) repeat protein
VASVEGETFAAEVLARVEAADEGEVVRCLSHTLDREHRLVSALGVQRMGSQRVSRYRFRHILFQKHLYNHLDPVERVHLHQAVGMALETLYGGVEEELSAIAPRLAWHFQQAGIAEKAIEHLYQAGARAQRLYANEEAAGHFRRALGLLEEAPVGEFGKGWRLEMAAQLCEKLGDVLEWTGEHDEARGVYQRALTNIPPGDWLWQARLHCKAGNVWRLQRRYEEALQCYDLAETALEQGSVGSAPGWRQEWIQIQLERMWLYYWTGQWREISELADQARSVVERHGTPSQCISFFLSLATMYFRRDRYVVSDETLSFCQTALAISQESENLGEIAWARFTLGFTQLWHGDLDGAEKQMLTALALAERTGDIVHQSRCLTYLTILHRKRGQLEKARQYVSRSLAAAKAAQMHEYIGTAHANLAWVGWREGNLGQAEANGRTALELWQQLPASHSSCSFQWTALWPLMGVALVSGHSAEAVSEASEFARALLEPMQQRLPDVLTAALEKAVEAWGKGASETARTFLDQAFESAQALGYL